jgi:hypothetical protein
MIAGLQEVDAGLTDSVHEAVLLRDTAGPSAGQDVFQRLGLTDSGERVA